MGNSSDIGKKSLKMGKRTLKVILLVITVLMALLLVASAWGGVIDPRKSTLFPMLTLGLPIVFVVNLVILVAWLLFMRWQYALIPLAAILISWSPISTVCPLNFFSKNYDSDSSFKVMSYNVANFDYTNQDKPSKPMRHILDMNADFVLMQEGSQDRYFLTVPNVIGMREEIEQKYPYHSDGYRDLVILSKYPYIVVPDSAFVTSPDQNVDVYAKAFDIEMPNGKQLRIISLHLRSLGMDRKDKNLYTDLIRREVNVNNRSNLQRIKHSLYDKLRRAFVLHAEEAEIIRSMIDNGPSNVIVCGDFNEVPSSYCYRKIRGDDFHDSFQDCGCGFTYTFNASRMHFKIDHILYRGDMEAVDWRRDKIPDSDHFPQVVTFVWK
ncbi:MAG: endonuclease/exonuclease/phosphatase family protein [Muribaculaceae bacterium]|nr:endonuclease/exonuclease/phosphatase family protein [Muribaculaceae bacterium]